MTTYDIVFVTMQESCDALFSVLSAILWLGNLRYRGDNDNDCLNDAACQGTLYGIPFEQDCTNGVDDDVDGNLDCLDSDCALAPNCMGGKYAAPMK